MRHVLQFRQTSGRKNSNHRFSCRELAIKRFDFVRFARRIQPHINGGKNPAFHRQQVRAEDEVLRRQARVFLNFGRVAMRKKPVGAEIFIHFYKMRFALGFFARAADAGFAVAHNSARHIDPAGFHQRPQPQNHRSRIAAGIRDQARVGQLVGVEFRQAVDSFGKYCGVRRRKLVPLHKSFGLAETKRAAQIHDAQRWICSQERGYQFQRGLVRRGEKHGLSAALRDRLDRKRLARSFAPTAKLRIELCQAAHIRVRVAQIKSRLFDLWVPQQEPG